MRALLFFLTGFLCAVCVMNFELSWVWWAETEAADVKERDAPHSASTERHSPTTRPQVDLIVRAYHGDLPFLLPLLRSIDIFVPREILGGTFVVLDAESQADHQVAALLASSNNFDHHVNVTVLFEREFNASVHGGGFGMNSKREAAGWVRSQLSNMYADQIGTSEFIGILDSDVVLNSHAIETTMFRNGRPVIFCTHRREMGMENLYKFDPALKPLKPFSCMENFPFVFRRSSFAKMRRWVMRRSGGLPFVAAMMKIVGKKPSLRWGNFAHLGAFAYTYLKDEYHWAIPGASACPELRSAIHVGYSMKDWHLDAQKLNDRYFATAAQAIAYGQCRAERICRSTSSPFCSKILASVADDYYLLSFEGLNEMMWGRAVNLSPKCKEHYHARVKEQEAYIRERRCQHYTVEHDEIKPYHDD